MIGMHQMSYSPAAAAAAAGAPSAGQQAGRKSSKAAGRQKQHFPELEQEQEIRRHAQYHRFDSTLDYDQRAPHSSGGQPDIVRVPARTAHPIVVDSLPDCAGRKPRSSSRKQELIELQQQQQQPQHKQRLIHYDAKEFGDRRPPAESHETRHFLLQQALEQSSRDEQQVLLIMSDHSSKTAGIPVIGRRLPSKSFGPPPGAKPVLIQELPPVVTEAILQHQQQQQQQQQQQAPVIGRRSHRMLKQQLEGANYEQQRALKCASLSVLSSAESQLVGTQQQQQQLVRRQASGASNKRLASKRKSAARIERRASNSCSSLCSPAPPVCLESCCQPAPVVELLRCHTNYVEPRPLTVATSSPAPAPPVCLLPCCYAAPCERPAARRHHPQVRSSSQSASRRSQRSAEPSGQRFSQHDSCQANGRSSHKSSSQPASGSSRPRHRLSGQQGPPVPSKPSLAGYQPAGEPLDENEHVTQMYESLAAELKAKLGNPNRAPILLPPKDYDTLSRQQGKLTGIELRRSTNPQLVGPAVAAAKTSPNHCQQSSPGTTSGCSLAHNQSGSPSSLSSSQSARHCASTVGEPSSSRSSGRGSETNALSDSRVDSFQRSRSNSSSGLGSISLGARSPSSACSPESPTSKASSSEHIDRQLFHGERHHREPEVLSSGRRGGSPPDQEHELDGRRGKGIENHNPSKVSDGILWNGRVEIPLKVNSERRDGNTYLATKQIIY